jgi:hypothetical protein
VSRTILPADIATSSALISVSNSQPQRHHQQRRPYAGQLPLLQLQDYRPRL